jgi:mRNA interferase MazF
LSGIPDRGDIVWLDFDPQAGHEQAGRRPAVVLTPKSYNARSGLMIVCQVTSRIKNYPFEVPVSAGSISGVILADHISCVDFSARRAKYAAGVSEEVLAEILAKISPLLGVDR